MKKLSVLLVTAFLFSSCSDGDNGGEEPNPVGGIQLQSQLELEGTITDVWGYVDDSTGKEYAIVGFGIFINDANSGIHIVDVSDPTAPVLVSTIRSVPGFDVKVFENYVYTVDGTSNGDGGIVDLSDPANPVKVGTIPNAHNIAIADGYMYLESPGVRIFNLNASQTNPPQISSVGSEGHDATVIDNRLYDFHGFAGINIYDVTDPGNPDLLTSWKAPSIIYHHSGWPTEDGNYLVVTDELSTNPRADITVWDISDLTNPQLVSEYNEERATVHNVVVIGDIVYAAYYAAGFCVFDISDPTDIQLIESFDTSFYDSQGFSAGAFGVYPFAPSGNIYITDQTDGLFIFSFDQNPVNPKSILAP